MRSIPALLGLVLAACGSIRRPADPRVAPDPRPRPSMDVARRSRPAEQPALACVDHPLVSAWERRMRTRRELADDTRETMARGAPYLPQLRQLVVDAGLPAGLALLPAVESGFEPRARGRHGELVQACGPQPSAAQVRVAAAPPPPSSPARAAHETRSAQGTRRQAAPHCTPAFARKPDTGIALAAPPAL